ncbi:uncharacterized protein LOC117650894 [Thrips palmi]|uniref:Uncharacterized protein LOC117650894 n=1 Tax=Thrips palmi TaxID=161013 RepID=A0A6P8ZZ46_THRPL|nr:uncharacterized protein LOC117650894 [Thrips palmi]
MSGYKSCGARQRTSLLCEPFQSGLKRQRAGQKEPLEAPSVSAINMKSCVVVLCVLLALEPARGDSAFEKELKINKQCAAENNVKLDDIKPLFDEKDLSKDAKCFLKCTMVALAALTEDGTIVLSEHLKEIGLEEFLPIADACKDMEQNDDRCEMAYQHIVCMLKQDSEGKLKNQMLGVLEKM